MTGLKMIKLAQRFWCSEENDGHVLSKDQTNTLGSLKLSANYRSIQPPAL